MAISPHQRHFAPSNPLNCKRFPDRHQLQRTLRDITKINVCEGSVTALTGGDIRPALGLWGVGGGECEVWGGSKSLAVIQGVCNPVLFFSFFLFFFPRRACNVPADVTAETLSLALVHFGCRNKSETEKKRGLHNRKCLFLFFFST